MSPEKYKKPVEDINEYLKTLHGELDDRTARITLAQFLYRNLGYTVELISGIRLYNDQIVVLKGMLQSNYSLCIWSRGVSKTFTSAMFCILQCIFFPGSNIVVCGPTFRTSRFIFNKIVELAQGKDAQLLYQALGYLSSGVLSKRNDEFKLSINGGSIISIPLSGDKVRGYRANVLVIDELRLMSEDVIQNVLMPFLVVPQDLTARQKIRKQEDELIRKGVLKENERIEFPNDAKFIGLSSASYQCEYLYKKFDEFVKQIHHPDMPKNGAKYFVSQLAWNGIDNPKDRLDASIIEMANSDESNCATFKREYGAQFIDDSDSYFSMKKMIDCTIPDGESPTLLLKGDKNKKYLLSIDPNLSGSDTSDHFAMCVIQMDDEVSKERKFEGAVVHNYAKAGEDLKAHIKYLFYLLSNFNIEMIIIDNAGYQFIEAANESDLFRGAGIEIKIFEFSAEKEGTELEEQLRSARRGYNKENKKIAFTQVFTSDSIRKMNENLQTCIDFKKIWFGSLLKGTNESAFNKAIQSNINLTLVGEDENKEFTDSKGSLVNKLIDTQESLIKLVKYECAAIEVKTTSKGTQSFDLPQLFRRDNSANRIRKDSYTALMLGCWLMKQYCDIFAIPADSDATFTPMMN